jgi:hypothetical protein
MRENIKLSEFLDDVIKAYDLDDNEFSPTSYINHICSSCGQGYHENDKFCSLDGNLIVEKTYEELSDDTKDDIYRTIYGFQEYENIPESFPYEYVDAIETRGDGSGYYYHIIFKRKSDGKFFEYSSYDGRIEEDSLYETKQEFKIKWDFQ